MRNPDRIKKTNPIGLMYPNIVHMQKSEQEIGDSLCNSTQATKITNDSDKVTCNSCKRRIKRK